MRVEKSARKEVSQHERERGRRSVLGPRSCDSPSLRAVFLTRAGKFYVQNRL